jgi:hypothetical protein
VIILSLFGVDFCGLTQAITKNNIGTGGIFFQFLSAKQNFFFAPGLISLV